MAYATYTLETETLTPVERLIIHRIQVLIENDWTIAQIAEALDLTEDQIYWYLSRS